MKDNQMIDFYPPFKYRFHTPQHSEITKLIISFAAAAAAAASPKTPSLPQNLQIKPQQISAQPNAMDSSSSANRPSPRQLQGPRPAPLKVSKDSYKINKKPPTIPNNPNNPPQPQPQPQPPRPPVIIYTVSPKIIHTNPADFMTLVQRLTGPDSAADPSIPSPSAALSPAARFAAIERAEKSSPRKNAAAAAADGIDHIVDVEEGANGMLLDRPSSIPGILSPIPSSLQPFSSSFFSPIATFDPGSLSFLNDLSPGPGLVSGGSGGGGGNSNFIGSNNFLISPNNLLSAVPSPGSYWDLFNDL